MKRTGILFLMLTGIKLFAQEPDVQFQGTYNDMPFGTFISEVEQKTEARFFYKDSWISGVTITAQGNPLSLREVLKVNLRNTDIYFYIDSDKTVFLTKGKKLVTTIPAYQMAGYSEGYTGNGKNGFLTETQRSYIEGRKQTSVATIDVGSPDNIPSNGFVRAIGRIKERRAGKTLPVPWPMWKKQAKGSLPMQTDTY